MLQITTQMKKCKWSGEIQHWIHRDPLDTHTHRIHTYTKTISFTCSLFLSLPLTPLSTFPLTLFLTPSIYFLPSLFLAGGEEAGWISAGVREILAVNNRGIINRSLHSNFECCSFSHIHTLIDAHVGSEMCTLARTHTHTGIQSISKVALSPAYENGTSEISSFILDN